MLPGHGPLRTVPIRRVLEVTTTQVEVALADGRHKKFPLSQVERSPSGGALIMRAWLYDQIIGKDRPT